VFKRERMQIKIGLSTGQVASLKDAMNERGRRGTGIRRQVTGWADWNHTPPEGLAC